MSRLSAQPSAPGKSGVLLAATGEPTILVQSLVRPELTPEESRCTEVSAKAWHCEPGERVFFRLAINPVSRTTRYYSDSGRRSPLEKPSERTLDSGRRDRTNCRQTAAVVTVADFDRWVGLRLGGALRDIQVMVHARDTTYAGHGAARHKLVVDSLDGVASVDDTSVLDQLRLDGVGRGKAYGCGLLTVARA